MTAFRPSYRMLRPRPMTATGSEPTFAVLADGADSADGNCVLVFMMG
ncbi:hypothetical protein [Ruegeria sp. HKCCSP351]|nr:hypothetical protein [Ruegeria sp. HKCCSP351]